ncbi:MAG: hypothetical protein WAN43_07845 [Rhodomicrobium sp.]|jgi:hypothetical protein
MNENERSEVEMRLPAQQTLQPQPASFSREETLPRENALNAHRTGDGPPNADLDEARFTAGVVKLYEALLKEPIPEEMLRLVEELSKQERG